jgi:Phage capsid family
MQRALVPEDLQNGRLERRSFVRAIAAMTIAARDNVNADAVLARAFPGDAGAQRVLKAATSPTTSAGFPQSQTMRVLPQLAPQSASSRLLALATPVDLTGITTIRVPYIGATGRPPVPFVGEGQVMPITNLMLSSLTIGPAKKLLIGSTLTREVQEASGNNAERIISDALSVSAEQSLDALLFSNAAATAAAPAGLLNGLTAIPSAGTKGAEGAADDLGLLADAIAAAGINADGAIFVTTAKLATKLRVLASLKFNNEVLSSSSVPAGEVIAVVPQGFVTAYDGSVSVEISNKPNLHFEDATPADIVTPGTPPIVAAPVKSMWQTDSLALKIRGWCAWAIHPGAVAYVTGASW